MDLPSLFGAVISEALSEVAARGTPVFTFALYHDHESGAISVCVDTEESSKAAVLAMNAYGVRQFMEAVSNGDLGQAALWQANVGRSLSLGDFALVNLARTELGPIEIDEQFCLAMVRALVAVQTQVAALSPSPERLVFACSGENDEVAYVWSLPRAA